MTDKVVHVYPHQYFEEQTAYLNDATVEDENWAFIDIIGTPACLKYYLEEEDTHHVFNEPHDNVLNLEFDDLPCDEFKWKGHTFYGISDEQAEKIVDFIENNINKNFMICCRAGKSRSQAVGEFILYFYEGFKSDDILHTPNKEVYRKLSRAYYKKHNIYVED